MHDQKPETHLRFITLHDRHRVRRATVVLIGQDTRYIQSTVCSMQWHKCSTTNKQKRSHQSLVVHVCFVSSRESPNQLYVSTGVLSSRASPRARAQSFQLLVYRGLQCVQDSEGRPRARGCTDFPVSAFLVAPNRYVWSRTQGRSPSVDVLQQLLVRNCALNGGLCCLCTYRLQKWKRTSSLVQKLVGLWVVFRRSKQQQVPKRDNTSGAASAWGAAAVAMQDAYVETRHEVDV